LDSLHGGFLELCRVHLVRYLEHLCFPSFAASLYTTCWKAEFQGKLSFLAGKTSWKVNALSKN
ncbi:hypothetical protein, partial [Burkholderia ubonensis]|uniref:hypothetical protein n=1 Tax=Burkholderia ubonensis TaxID=101571 RepID=UPI001E2BE247